MNWIISITIIFSAVCCVTAHVSHQYHFVNENKTWNDAHSYCREKYTDLATINNMEEVKNLNDTLMQTNFRPKTPNRIWIGLQRDWLLYWKWQWSDATRKTYHNWCKWNPNKLSSTACVQMWDSGCWTDESCEAKNQFVCYDETKQSNGRYILVPQSMSWCDAQEYCRENHTDLASVRNNSENQQIHNVIKNSAWVGLFRRPFKWSDGSNSCYRNWASNEPHNLLQNCGTLLMTNGIQTGQWGSWSCDNKIPFICYNSTSPPNANVETGPSEEDTTDSESAVLILIKKQNLTWVEAVIYCRKHYVDLVSVYSEEIHQWVVGVAQKASTANVWIGLHYTCTLDFWFWVNESVCYQNWAPGNGTGEEDCNLGERSGAIQSKGEQQWVGLDENQELNFICTKYDV